MIGEGRTASVTLRLSAPSAKGSLLLTVSPVLRDVKVEGAVLALAPA